MDIFEFMNNGNYDLKSDNHFLKLWSNFDNKDEILVTSEILEFIGFIDETTRSQKGIASEDVFIKNKRSKFIEFLKKNNIEYEQIDYKHEKAKLYKFIQDDIKKANSHTLHTKRWLLMSIDNFKEAIVILNNKKSKVARRYLDQIEKIVEDYRKYLDECKLLKEFKIDKKLDIFEYMRKNDIILSEDNHFLKLWSNFDNIDEILVTSEMLEFIGFIDEITRSQKGIVLEDVFIKNKRSKFIEFLKKNDIEYEHIDYQHEKAKLYKFIQDDIEKGDPRTIHLKRWLLMSIDNFKEAILMLNNKKSKVARKYLIQVEKLFKQYGHYSFDYVLNLEKAKTIIKDRDLKEKQELLAIKDKEIVEKEQEKQELLKENITLKEKTNYMKNVLNNVKKRVKNGYIYIATSKLYASNGIYKVGISKNLLEYRQSQMNTSHIKDDQIYISFYSKVYDMNKTEKHIHDALSNYRDNDRNEWFHVSYKLLKSIVKSAVKGNNEVYDIANDNITNFENEKTIPDRIIFKDNTKLKVEKILKNCINNNKPNIKKKDLNLNNDEWKEFKNLFGWKSSKEPITFNNCKIYISYN